MILSPFTGASSVAEGGIPFSSLLREQPKKIAMAANVKKNRNIE